MKFGDIDIEVIPKEDKQKLFKKSKDELIELLEHIVFQEKLSKKIIETFGIKFD